MQLQILRDAEMVASRMVHRGATGCDNDTGDGVCFIVQSSITDAIKRLQLSLVQSSYLLIFSYLIFN